MVEANLKSYIETPAVDVAVFVAGVFEEAERASAPAAWPRFVAMAATLALVAGSGALLWSRSAAAPPPGAVLRTDRSAVSVALGADGSTFNLEAQSQAQLVSLTPAEVVVQLVSGKASFSVSRNPSRSFRVVAGTTEVRVHGTRFVVERVGESAVVAVSEGIVEVREHGKWVMNLTADQQYTGKKPLTESLGAAPAAKGEFAAGSGGSADSVEPGVVGDGDAFEAPVLAPAGSKHEAPRVTRTRSSTSLGAKLVMASVGGGSGEATPSEPQLTAETLFDGVREERRQGHYAKAAGLLGALLEKFPGSEQEGLAAFELARLRMDQLNDVSGAIAPLMLAQSKLPSAPLREDAAARLVRAYQLTKRIDACEASRSEYLRRFPGGIHRPSVELLCPPSATP